MKLSHAIVLAPAFAVAGIVASTFAQDDGKPRNSDYSGVRTTGNHRADTLPPGALDPNGRFSSLYPLLAGRPVEGEAMIASEADALAHQLASADSDTQRNELKAKLRDALSKQFDMRQKRHGQEIDALEAQVKKLKALVQKRQENRAEIIAHRLDQIVRESEGLGF
jgi:hypothetical protein